MVKTKRPSAGCLRHLLCAGILLAATTVASATELFDFEPAFDPAPLTARGVTIAVTNGALEIKGTVPAADYCVAAVRAVCEQFGGDAGAVFFVGTNPGRPWKPAGGTGWNQVGVGWDERAARLKGRPWFAAPANLGAHVHVDVEYLEDRP